MPEPSTPRAAVCRHDDVVDEREARHRRSGVLIPARGADATVDRGVHFGVGSG